MGKQTKHNYEFGPFHLDATERVLFRDGVPVSLTPKALETLIVLVQHSGHVVEKDELMKAVWPDAFVEEGGLTRNISVLRKILNNGQEEKQYIETLPRRGYRFTADVRETFDQADEIIVERHAKLRVTTEEEVAESEPEGGFLIKPKSRLRWHPIASALALITLVAMGTTIYLWASRRTKQAAPSAPPRSMAVLPFKEFSNDDDQQLGLGLADALITRLGNIKQLIIRPTSAVLKYTSQAHEAALIGKELNVESVLDGSVQRVNGNVRVSLQLINVSDGATMWTAIIDEESKDILRLQDKVATQVVEALSLRLANPEQTKIAKRGTNSIEAYSAYLKGRILWNKRTPETLKQSLAHFNSAIEQDPLYALAYAGLADTYVLLGEYNLTPPGDTFPKAKAAAQKALELDPNLGEAYTVFAYALANYDWDFSGSEAAYRRALELSPNYATAHQWYAEYLSLMRRFDEARQEIKRAQELDPLSPIIGSVAGLIEYHARNPEQASAQLRRVIELEPNFAPAHAYLSLAYEISNRTDGAVAEQVKAMQLSGAPPQLIEQFQRAYERGGFAAYLNAALEVMRTLESQSIYVSPFEKATIYAKLGDREQALRYLEKAFNQHMRYVAYIHIDPSFDSLRDESRFQELLKRIGFQAG
jgi:DNA-binding winged helix-turn-helix (wHTH) protein/TolB-like protein/Tfp pilus assembly protein PilF